jgi:arsenate reductase
LAGCKSASEKGIPLKKILFLCMENRARSQMAEGLARHFVGHQNDFFSAGSKPSDRIHPMAIAVMAEIGIDITGQKTKSLLEVDPTKMDLIITLCNESECPTLPPHIKHEHWETPDPAKESEHPTDQIKKFRKIRDAIRQRVLTLRASTEGTY